MLVVYLHSFTLRYISTLSSSFTVRFIVYLSEGEGKIPRGGKHLLPCLSWFYFYLLVCIGKKDRAGQNKKYGITKTSSIVCSFGKKYIPHKQRVFNDCLGSCYDSDSSKNLNSE